VAEKITVDFGVTALNFDGKPLDFPTGTRNPQTGQPDVESKTLAWWLANNILAGKTDGPAMTILPWMFRLGEVPPAPLELSVADYDLLDSIVDKSGTALLLRGQVQKLMSDARAASKAAEAKKD